MSRPLYGVTGPLPPAATPAPTPRPAGAPSGGFAGTLSRALQGGLSLSRHAQERLSAAGRSLSPDEAQRIRAAMQSAASKGSRQALLLLPDLALVVHPPSGTVITAVTDQRRQSGLFTGIDCTVIL